jgi:hydrogenase expression/formation protein HypC
MCLSVPSRVLDVVDPETAVVVHRGVRSTVSLLAADTPVGPGDWVLVHSGFVLGRLTDDDVRELTELTDSGGGA